LRPIRLERVLDSSAFGAKAALRLGVPRLPRPRTLAVALGDWLGPAALLLVLGLLAARATAERLRPGGSTQSSIRTGG
jgi:hypothetical protein